MTKPAAPEEVGGNGQVLSRGFSIAGRREGMTGAIVFPLRLLTRIFSCFRNFIFFFFL